MCRGGIPICWPQFNDMGPTQSHGFARNTEFTVIDGSDSFVTLRLSSSDDTRELWPHDFELTVRIEITGSGALLQEVRSFVGFRFYQPVAEPSGQCRSLNAAHVRHAAHLGTRSGVPGTLP